MKAKLRRTPFGEFASVFCFFLVMSATIGFFSFAASAQTVDEVIAKNIQAKGGADKLKSVRTVRITTKFSQGSFRAEFRQEIKRADKVREEFIIQGLAQVQAYDGKTGWQISPFGGRKDPELLSQDDLKSLIVDADIDGPLVNYKEKGHKAELVGLFQNQTELEKRGRALLLLGCGLVPGAESGNSGHDSRRAAGIRGVLRRLRTGERHLLSLCRRTGAKGQCFTGAVLRRKNRTKHSAGRRALFDAGV